MNIDQSNANDGGTNPANESLSEADLIAQLSGEGQQQEEEPEETEEESEEVAEVEETDTEEESEETEEDEESEEETEAETGIDFDSLSEDEWEAIRTKLKSKAAARIQELTAKVKAKDEELTALQGQKKQTEPEPEKVESRFLKEVDSPEKLTAKVSELKKLAKDTRRLLDDHEDYALTDVIEVGSQSYTKKQLKELDRDLREALDEAVPYMASKFNRLALIEREHAGVEARLKNEVKELEDENSEVAKTFKGLIDSPLFKGIIQSHPEAKPVLHLLAGFGVKGILRKAVQKAPPTEAGKKTKAKPPSSPSGSAAAPARAAKEKGKSVYERKFEESGSAEDLVRALSD